MHAAEETLQSSFGPSHAYDQKQRMPRPIELHQDSASRPSMTPLRNIEMRRSASGNRPIPRAGQSPADPLHVSGGRSQGLFTSTNGPAIHADLCRAYSPASSQSRQHRVHLPVISPQFVRASTSDRSPRTNVFANESIRTSGALHRTSMDNATTNTGFRGHGKGAIAKADSSTGNQNC